MCPRASRCRYRLRAHLHIRPDFIRPARRDVVARTQVTKHLDEWAGGHAGLDVDPFGPAVAHADDERTPGGASDAAARHEQRRPGAMHGPSHLTERAGRETV